MTRIEKAARKAVVECLGVKKGESVLILIDEPYREIGYLLWQAALRVKAETLLLEILPRKRTDMELPPGVAQLMKYMDAVLVLTVRSLLHSQAREEACQNGTRILILSNITPEVMEQAVNVDYAPIVERSRKLAEILSIGKVATITTPAGTDIILPIANAQGCANTGMAHRPGDVSTLPAGEASIVPDQRKSRGKIVIDGSIGRIGIVSEPVHLTVNNGYVSKITGGKDALRMRKLIKPFGKPARYIAELGIGTNDKAQLVGNTHEDEKVLGTVHIAIGDHRLEGGSLKKVCHLDAILLNPTLVIDGKVILEAGKLLI